MKRFLISVGISMGILYANSGVLEVDWPKLDKNQIQMQKAYPPLLSEKLNEVTLPVYLPQLYIHDQNMSIVADANYYTVIIYLDKARLMVSGDRTYQESVAKADQSFKAMMKSTETHFIHAEGMMMTDFNRHGVNYSLMLECDLPKTDERCTDESFLRNIYDQLVLVGGKR